MDPLGSEESCRMEKLPGLSRPLSKAPVRGRLFLDSLSVTMSSSPESRKWAGDWCERRSTTGS